MTLTWYPHYGPFQVFDLAPSYYTVNSALHGRMFAVIRLVNGWNLLRVDFDADATEQDVELVMQTMRILCEEKMEAAKKEYYDTAV